MKVKKVSEAITNGNIHFVQFECDGSQFQVVKDYSKEGEWVMLDPNVFLKSKQIDELKGFLKKIDETIFP